MIGGYQYKLQWLFAVREDELIDCFAVLKILGAGVIDKIVFRDENYAVIEEYSGYKGQPSVGVFTFARKYIKQRLKDRPDIKYVELFKV